ncbi:MAG: response regulator [Campylobacterales bacterium]|nr:response regulator [Campylobacterales bacterium]
MNETQKLREALHHIVALVVDDEAAVRDATCRLMQRFFDRVDCAADATEALEKFSITQYDLLLCDLRMPGMDGLTLMQTLLERGYDPFRVIFSGTVDPVDTQNVAHLCFPKPVDFAMITQLLRALEAHLASKEG